jgi:hypothetical protein
MAIRIPPSHDICDDDQIGRNCRATMCESATHAFNSGAVPKSTPLMDGQPTVQAEASGHNSRVRAVLRRQASTFRR